jgi:hypothetical protein
MRALRAAREQAPPRRDQHLPAISCRRVGGDEEVARDPCLGQIAHQTVIATLNLKRKDHAFGHGARYEHKHLTILGSYHCSRYNTNTGVLTEAMFDAVMGEAKRAAGL